MVWNVRIVCLARPPKKTQTDKTYRIDKRSFSVSHKRRMVAVNKRTMFPAPRSPPGACGLPDARPVFAVPRAPPPNARPPVGPSAPGMAILTPPNARPPVMARRTMASSAGRSWSGNRIVPTRRTMASALRFRPARGLPDAGRKKRLSGADSLNALAVSLVFDTLEFLLQLKVAAQEADRSDGEDQQQKTGVHIHNDLLSGITCCGRGRDCRRRGRRWRRGRERTG